MSSEEGAGVPYEEYEEEEEQQQEEEEVEEEYEQEAEQAEYEEEVYEEDLEENPYKTHETAVDDDPFNAHEEDAADEDYEPYEGEEEEAAGEEEPAADEAPEAYEEAAVEEEEYVEEEEEEEQIPVDGQVNDVVALQQALNEQAEAAEAAEEGVEGEEPVEEQEVVLYSDYADPKLLIAEVHRIDESCMIIMRGLTSISTQRDDDLRVNLLDICGDLQAEEEMLFSPMPDYVSRVLDSEKKRHADYNRNVQPHPECRQSGLSNSNFSGERRAFVDPRIPLPMPYSIKRFKEQHPERQEARGTYHELFFGDRNSVEFKPPADNKRKQIEDQKKGYPVPQRHDRAPYEPQPKPAKKVPADFVPSCANVDNSAAKKRLEQYKKYRRTYLQ